MKLTKEHYDILTEKVNKMIDNDEVRFIKFDYNEEENILDIIIVPVKSLEHVTVNINVTPLGMEFTDT